MVAMSQVKGHCNLWVSMLVLFATMAGGCARRLDLSSEELKKIEDRDEELKTLRVFPKRKLISLYREDNVNPDVRRQASARSPSAARTARTSGSSGARRGQGRGADRAQRHAGVLDRVRQHVRRHGLRLRVRATPRRTAGSCSRCPTARSSRRPRTSGATRSSATPQDDQAASLAEANEVFAVTRKRFKKQGPHDRPADPEGRLPSDPRRCRAGERRRLTSRPSGPEDGLNAGPRFASGLLVA
jgi:hypothetical protein